MKTYKPVLKVLAGVLTLLCIATAAEAPKLTFEFKKANAPGALQTFPYQVNNKGIMVGQYEDKKGVNHGYILNGKNLTKLDRPTGSNTACYGINLNGAISVVGTYTNSNGNNVGFLYKNGKFTDIPGPAGATSSGAANINDSGAIVGVYVDSSGVRHGFLLKDNNYTTMDPPGSIHTVAAGINDKGYIVLYWEDSKGVVESSISRDSGKTYKTINVPDAPTGSAVQSINSAGDRVYQWGDSSGAAHGALFHAGTYYKFDYPESVFTSANGINDKSLIVGLYEAKSNGPSSGYKATFK
jgi:probable HAF family extracellular repeat protein